MIERDGEELACASQPGLQPRLRHGAVQAHFQRAGWAALRSETARQLGVVETVAASDECSELMTADGVGAGDVVDF